MVPPPGIRSLVPCDWFQPPEYAAQVCNHPDLFAGRPIESSFDMPEPIDLHYASKAMHALDPASAMDFAGRLDGLLVALPALNILEQEGTAQWEAAARRASGVGRTLTKP
eukprot:1092533-Prorocentrum_minimum.AAC.4